MASIVNLINNKNFETFEELKKFFEEEPYFFDVITTESGGNKATKAKEIDDDVDAITEEIRDISVGEGEDLSNLYMLSFTQKSDLSTKIAREANGIIFEKGTNNLVHYLFEKCYDGVETTTESDSVDSADLLSVKLFDERNTYVELFFEGSVIKLFNYKDAWRLATSRCLNADKASWSSKKTFGEMFKECICTTYDTTWDNFIKHQTKNYCSSYIIQHPQNKMAINVATPVAFLLNIVHLQTLEELRLESDNLKVSQKYSEIVANKRKLTENFIVFQVDPETDTVIHRIKVLSDEFLERKKIYGNQQNIGLRYLEVLKDEKQTDLLRKTFPEYVHIFNRIDKIFYNTCKKIHRMYIQIYVKKESKDTCPELYKRTMTQLHAQYRKTKEPITIQDVFYKLENLQPRVIANLIDYKY